MITDKKGFTLIEVIIVVVIMTAAIGLATPRIGKSLGKMKLKSAVPWETKSGLNPADIL